MADQRDHRSPAHNRVDQPPRRHCCWLHRQGPLPRDASTFGSVGVGRHRSKNVPSRPLVEGLLVGHSALRYLILHQGQSEAGKRVENVGRPQIFFRRCSGCPPRQSVPWVASMIEKFHQRRMPPDATSREIASVLHPNACREAARIRDDRSVAYLGPVATKNEWRRAVKAAREAVIDSARRGATITFAVLQMNSSWNPQSTSFRRRKRDGSGRWCVTA